MRSRARNTTSSVFYYNNWNWHNDNYSVNDFVYDGARDLQTTAFHVTDNPEVNNNLFTAFTNIRLEFDFRQSIVFGKFRYTTPDFSAVLAGAGPGAVLTVTVEGAPHVIGAPQKFVMNGL